ncbi:hypothetical protein AB0K80_32275 [Streptomyces sp. NPDC052682]|uniref:hypothetical protein n=1 Tax=Streptomyces sp. NPDC052682 TaxID=3154954 RepID=UPI00343C69AA
MQPVPGPAQALVVLPTARSKQVAHRRLSPTGADLVRIVSDPGTPVFLTVHADGRRRYSYWQPYDPGTGRGSCYVALPTEECDALHAAGRITLGEPVVDPARTTYRVRAATRTPAAAGRTRATTARTPATAATRTGAAQERPVRPRAQRARAA